MKAALLLVALLLNTAFGQDDPVEETEVNGLLPVSEEVDESQEIVIEPALGSHIKDVLDELANGNEAASTGEGFQYTNIRLETSTPMDMFDASEFNADEANSGSWMDKMKPWKRQDSPVPAPVPQGSYVSGVSGGSGGALLSGFDGQAPPVNPQSEAEMLLAKQELLLALLEDTEQALMAKQ